MGTVLVSKTPLPNSRKLTRPRENRGSDVDEDHDIELDSSVNVSYNRGAAYANEIDKENEQANRIGIAYQISAVGPVDTVMETFEVQVQLTILFAIEDSDHIEYEKQRKDGQDSKALQKLHDNPNVQSKPPIYELLNARHITVIHARITGIVRMFDGQEWRWYVQLFHEVRAVCYESLEYDDFPFSRQLFQIRIGLKAPSHKQVLRPFNEVQPRWSCRGGNVTWNKLRPNLFKHSSFTVGSWELKNHSIDFLPNALLPEMPSGDRFSVCTIAMFMQQVPDFFVANTFGLMSLVTLLAMVLATMVGSTGGSIEVFATLMVVQAQFKQGMSLWVPLQGKLNRGDKYMLGGILITVLLAIFAAGDTLARDLDVVPEWALFASRSLNCDDTLHGEGECVHIFSYDRIIYLSSAVVWTLCHIYWLVLLRRRGRPGGMYTRWKQVR